RVRRHLSYTICCSSASDLLLSDNDDPSHQLQHQLSFILFSSKSMSLRPSLTFRRPFLGALSQHKPMSSDSIYHSCQGKLTIPNVCHDMVIRTLIPTIIFYDQVFIAKDLIDEGEIGRGAFGFVNRMVHVPTGSVMAVKRIRSTLNEAEQTKTLQDLDVVMNSADCPHIVRFYGALFEEGDCWICMEMMATSLDKFYNFVYHYLLSRIPEKILAKIAVMTIAALDYLKVELKVIHRGELFLHRTVGVTHPTGFNWNTSS
ncbi:hypothetical protein P879_10861, partial [Paragonimus westermani]